MSNKKKIIILSVIALLLISVLLLLNNYRNKNEVKNLNEVENLLENNKEILNDSGSAQAQLVRAIDGTDHVDGDEKAPVKLIIYNDFECDFCAKFQETIKKVKEVFGDKIVIAYRHFPLRSNPNAYYAALASECAFEQGKFWEMHDQLFLDNTENKMSFEQYRIDATNLGLDVDKFETCYNEDRYKEKIQANWNEGKNIGVTGSPQTFVNGKPLPGAYPFEDFTDSAQIQREGMKSVIEKALNNK